MYIAFFCLIDYELLIAMRPLVPSYLSVYSEYLQDFHLKISS